MLVNGLNLGLYPHSDDVRLLRNAEHSFVGCGERSETLYPHPSLSGHVSLQRVCGVCHTRIFNSNPARPGMVVLRAGTLDDSHLLSPIAHIWVNRKQPWVVIPDGVPTWPESPTPEEFMAAMRWAGSSEFSLRSNRARLGG